MSRWVQVMCASGVVVLGAALVPTAGVAAADEVVIEVTTTADVVDDGDGLTSLREAVSAANDVEGISTVRVLLGGGTHDLSICDGTREAEDDANADGDLDHTGTARLMIEQLTGASAPTIRQTCGADSGERVIDSTGHLVLVEVVVTGGDVAGDGGGVRAAELGTYELGVVLNRASGDGGGVFVTGETRLADSGISRNEAGRDGGGLATGTLVVSDNSGSGVSSNTAGRDGGGIFSTGSVVWGIDGVVGDNVAGRHGGGIAADDLVFSTVGEGGPTMTGNRAGGDGGGIHARVAAVGGGYLGGNGAVGRGGAVWAAEDLALAYTSLDGNLSFSDGAGVYAAGTATVDRVSIVGSAGLGDGAGAWFGGDAEVARLHVAGSQGRSAVVFDAGATVDALVVQDSRIAGSCALNLECGAAVLVGPDATWFRGLLVTGNERAGLVVRGPDGEVEGVAGGPHLLELSTLADNGGPALRARGSDVRVAGVALLGTCDSDRPLPGPDPSTSPPGSIGVQPSYATSITCDLEAPGSTVGGPVPTFDPPGDTDGYVPTWDSPLVGAIDLPAGADVRSWTYHRFHGWDDRWRPIGPRADIGAHEAGEPLVEPVPPRRALDTRRSVALGPGDVIDVPVADAGAVGAVVNVTLVDPTEATHLTVWPAGAPRPNASTVNAPAGGTVAAAAWVRSSPDGRISIRNQAGSAHVLVDVVGQLYDGGDAAYETAKAVTVVDPERAVDTRDDDPLAAGETRVLDLGDAVPAGADAAIVTVTGVDASAPTHLTTWRAGSPRPGASTLNLPAGATVANLALVGLDDEGRVAVRNAAGEVDVLIDVVGFLDEVAEEPADTDRGVLLTAPVRAFDSRAQGAGGPLAGGVVRTVDLTRRGALPIPNHASAAVVTLTLVAPSTAAHLTAWASGDARPPTSNVNAPAGVTRAGTAVVPLDADGEIDLRVSSGAAHVVVDVVGYLP